MVQGNWRSPSFWRWWWRSSAPGEIRAAVYVLGLALVLGGGWLAATQLSSAKAGVSELGSNAAAPFPSVRTVRIVRRVPKVEVKTRTRTEVVSTTRTVTVAKPVVHTVVNERTVTEVQPSPRARTVTRTIGYTLVRTLTDTQTQTETAPPVTVTQTLPAVVVTVVRTVTVKH